MSHTPEEFSIFGPSHIGALLVLLVAGFGLIRHSQTNPGSRSVRVCEFVLIGFLLLSLFFKAISQSLAGQFEIGSALPLHYCDVAAMLGVAALVTHRQRFCELVYLFGLAGTAQALITPSLNFDFPSATYFVFFAGHGAIVVTALYGVLGLKKAPLPGAVKRAMLASTAYALLVGVINALLGTNYGFVCAKPPTVSLMDALGPWPWYVLALWLIALCIYTVLYLPFRSTNPK
jgi:hypothetical integral membrane protein (TIGR02206 family)